ncbi:MAG: AAA family ATPase [Candidatus Velthaea sp.]
MQLLSSLRLTFNGRPHHFAAPPRTLPLFAYLLVNRLAPVARAALAYTLWPDDSEESARTNLRRHIHYLQKALPPSGTAPWLLVNAKTIQWNAASSHVLDAAEFERLSRSLDLSAAVDMYAGDLLGELDEEWLLYERERLRNLQAANLTALIEKARARRDFGEALMYAQRLLAHDPWREDAVRHVMSLRYELADRAGAAAEYERFRERLATEMGVDPMPETLACFNAIAGETVRAMAEPGAEQILPSSAGARWQLLPFAGRASETERLHEAWERCRNARGSAMLVGGEAGIGKTRLVTMFANDVEKLGAIVLHGSTSFPESTPYQAFAAALHAAIDDVTSLGIDGIWLDTLGEVIPQLRHRDGNGEALDMQDVARDARRLFEAFARVLQGLGERRAVLVVLEDLHWAGSATFALLESLVRRTSLRNVLIVATYREEEVLRDHPLRAFRRGLAIDSPRSHIALSPLDRTSIDSILHEIFGSVTVSPAFVDDLHARSAGNPFFVSELLRDAREKGAIGLAAGAPALTTGINAVVSARLRRLSPHGLAAAHLGAVIGQAFSAELLREAGGWSEAQTSAALDELQDHHIVHDAGAAPEDFRFSHHFIQAAAYGEIPARDVGRRHGRVARVMEELYSEQRERLASQLALHFDRAGDAEAAARYDLLAAHHALSLFAGDEAFLHAQRALEHSAERSTRAAAHLVLEEVYRRRGDRVSQDRELTEFEGLLDDVNDVPLRFEGLRRRIELAHVSGNSEAETIVIAVLRACAEELDLAHWLGIAHQADGIRLLAAGRLDDAHAALSAALASFDEGADSAMRIETYCSLAQVAVHRTRYDDATMCLDRAAELAEKTSAENLLYRIQNERYAVARFREDAEAVYTIAKDLLERARRSGDTQSEIFAHLRFGNAALARFAVPEARENIDLAYQMSGDVLNPKERFGIITCKGLLYFALGDYEAANALFEEARDLAYAHHDIYSQVLCDVNLASVKCADQRYAEAVAFTDDLVAAAADLPSKYLEATALGARGVALRGVGRIAEARRDLERSILLHRELDMASTIGSELAELALLYVSLGDYEAARTLASEVVTIASSSDASVTNGHFMLWNAACTFHALGDEERACGLRDEAYALYVERSHRIDEGHLRACFAQTWFVKELVAARASSDWPQRGTLVVL